jgi:hypothetical protein
MVMHRATLTCHPDTPCKALTAIDATVAHGPDGALQLTYVMRGDIAGVRLPQRARPERTDELWKHTCLEAFLQPDGGAGYLEFNFAPSWQWAAYRFDAYRAGMAQFSAFQDLRITVHHDADAFTLGADLTGLVAPAPWRLALSAVIEETSGAKSYWALAHPPGKPDFHHSDGFALELPAELT